MVAAAPRQNEPLRESSRSGGVTPSGRVTFCSGLSRAALELRREVPRVKRPGKNAGGCSLLRRQHHDHLAVLQTRHLLHLDGFAEFGPDSLKHLDAEILVGHFAAAKA